MVLLILFGIVVSGAVASRSVWWPYVKPYLPETGSPEDPRVAALIDRLGALEEKVQTTGSDANQQAETFQELELAREKLSAELAIVIERLETVEQSVKGVERMAAAVGSGRDTDAAEQSLLALVERVDSIEQTANVSPLIKRLDNLEQQTQAAKESLSQETQRIEDVNRRVDGLEAERLSPEYGLSSSASALILAVGQLRNAVRQGQPYATELANVIAVAPDDPSAASAIATLKAHAETGVTTLTGLQGSFAEVTVSVLGADSRVEGGGWVSDAINRLANLVTIRRVDGTAPAGSTDADIARAEANLAIGDLAATIDVLDNLSDPAAAAAQPWLAQARVTMAVQQALTQLNSVAITQLTAAQR